MHQAFSGSAAIDPLAISSARMEGPYVKSGASGSTPMLEEGAGLVPPAFCRVVSGLVAANSGLSLETLLASHRCAAPVARARQLAMYVAHVGLGISQADVARAFARDRSTVAHACRRIEDLRENDAFDGRVSLLENCARWILEGTYAGREG
ncbi:helix-turn-helix domain-containing protein [Xanthobacter sp. TB0139]|uniref:helix-turn-helix domain-containing protein n=1 Tax=Xanthobacter sp. TB0139 TaxID=3459178 RepID=UPI004039B835